MKKTDCGDVKDLIAWPEGGAAIATQTLETTTSTATSGPLIEAAGEPGRSGVPSDPNIAPPISAGNRDGEGGHRLAPKRGTVPTTGTGRGRRPSAAVRSQAGARGGNRKQENLREAGAFGRAIFEHWPEAVFLLDPHDWRVIEPAVECNGVDWEQGGVVRRFAWTLEWPVVDCNGAACRRHGYLRSELIGHPVGALGPLTSGPAVLRNLLGELMSQGIVRFQGLHRSKDGKYFPVEASASLVRLGDRELVIMLTRDAAPDKVVVQNKEPVLHREGGQNKQQEEQVRNVERWESIGRLAGGVAHDFNSILTEIRRCAEVIQLSPGASSELAPQLKQLVVTAERATTLTWQILALSGKQGTAAGLVDLNKLITEVVAMLEHVLRPDVEVDLKLTAGLPLIPAHGSMLEQVLVHLAINSRYAMLRGGRLVIETRVAEIDPAYVREQPEAKIGRHACLRMTDTGGGVSPARIGCIHEPFFTTRNVGQGTGLGLATVNGIIKQHQGWIDVAGAIGQGTRFTVHLPVNPPKQDPLAVERPHQPISGGSETILLAESELLLRALARSILQRYGYQVIEAASAAEALSAWEKHGGRIGLLLTEMGASGGLNGRDLAQQLLHGKNTRLKVLYASACSAAIKQFDSPLRPGVNFLPKPYSATALAQAVRNCLDAK